jgi:TM2 domain-containing membrane protein YozV
MAATDAWSCSMRSKSVSTSFWLWLLCIFGFCGVHRFYLGFVWTGLLWLFTFGLLGIGQLIDLFRLRSLTAMSNMERHLESRSI